MAPPSFLNTGFAFQDLGGAIVDVQSIIDALVTMLTTTLSATATNIYPSGERWTDLGGGVLKAPVDNGGRFMKITLVRTSATRMGFKIEDPTGTLVDGAIDIAAPGSTVFIYGGPAHVVVESNNAGSWEIAKAFLTDPTPEPLASSAVYVWGTTRRNAAGGLLSNSWIQSGGRYTGGTTTGTSFDLITALPKMPGSDNANGHLMTQAGSDVAAPFFMAPNNAFLGGIYRNVGKLYQAVCIDVAQIQGVDLTIPIDTGVTGQFRVIHIGPTGMTQVAVRKG